MTDADKKEFVDKIKKARYAINDLVDEMHRLDTTYKIAERVLKDALYLLNSISANLK